MEEVTDQQQPVINTTVGNLAIGWQSEQVLAQVITAGISGYLLAVEMPITRTSGDLVIEIQNVTESEPNGIVLTSETFNGTNFPAADSTGFRRFNFSTIIGFTAGNVFAIVMRSPEGSYSISQGPEGNPYSGGDGFFDARPNTPGVWVPISLGTDISDLPFKTIVGTN